MSDTENKKPSKGGEHTGSKKRAAAAAAAAVAAVAAESDATPADAIDDTANCLPKHKRSKHERNTAETQPDLAAVATTTTTEDANDEDEEISDQHDEASDGTHKPVDAEQNVKGTLSTAAPMDVVAERAVATGTVLTICAAARKLVNNVASSAKGPPDALATVSSAETFVLAMITNDVEHVSKMNKERESSFTALNFVPVKMLEAGYNSAPYEKVEGNAKNLVYCDKKGKLLTGRPTKLAGLTTVNNVKFIDMKTWEQHPTTMMKTKWRGLPTECVGVLAPGIPLSCNIFNENKDSIMQDETTESYLKPFSFAIIGIVIKSREQCEAGYGIGVKSVRHVPNVNFTMTGMYHDKFFYSDKSSIDAQTTERLSVKTRVSEYDYDLSFVSKLVRYVSKNTNSEKPVVTEKPVVYTRLQSVDGSPPATHAHRVHMQPNNKVLELEMVDTTSIYNGQRFRITIPENMFTINETGLDWIQFYYQWMLDINACSIMFVHDDYQYNRMIEGTATASMHCAIIPNESVLFHDKNAPLVLSDSLAAALDKGVKGRSNSFSMYTGWTLHTNTTTNKTYAMIFDKTKAYCPEEGNVQGQTTGDISDKSTEDTLAAIADANSEHTSIVCRIYKGMNVHRHIWRAYLLVIDNENDTIERMFQVGIKSQLAYADTAQQGISANGNIFESCDMTLG